MHLTGSIRAALPGRKAVARKQVWPEARPRPATIMRMLRKSTPLVLMLALAAAAQTIPAPESVLGHKPGEDFYLANYDESRDYFHKLAAVSGSHPN